jgi:IS6 family transposase
MGTRPAIFKWRQTEPGLILCAVRWYLRYSLSLRDVEELLEERGLDVDHTTVWRWVQYYGPELEQRLRQHLKPTNKSWRVDETYVRVKGSLVLLVSGHRFQGCDHRFPAVSVS